MKRHIVSAMFAIAALALVLTTRAAPAVEELPFAAVFESFFTGFDGPYQVYTGTGTGTHVGAFSHVSRVHIKGNGTAVGSVTITAANGDLLEIVFEQTFDADTGSFVGPYTIVSGTGRFADAAGSGTIVAVPPSNPGGPVTVTLDDGTISF